MATSDLLAELSKDTFRVAPDVEKKVCAVVLKQLDDKVGGQLTPNPPSLTFPQKTSAKNQNHPKVPIVSIPLAATS